MKKINLFLTAFLLFTLVIGKYNNSIAQCMLYEVSLDQRVLQSPYIIEGEVKSKTCFWNNDQSHIFTSNIIEVIKVFKGSIESAEIEVVTEGGIVGDRMEIVTPSLNFNVGEIGVFFGEFSNLSNTNMLSLKPNYSELSFVRYSKSLGKAFDHFKNYDIYNELYYGITRRTNQIEERKVFNALDYVSDFSLKSHSISSISPTTLSAGKKDVLTINGSGFGATKTGSAEVLFRAADNGGAGFVICPNEDILSWSETQITCNVPSGAGSGTIRVQDAAGVQSADGPVLTVSYNLTNLGGAGAPLAIMQNGASGYNYKYSTNTANNGVSFADHTNAKARFEDALENWRCNSGFNATANGTTSSINVSANDGEFVVMFDNDASPLSGAVLGTGHSYYSSCGSDWRVVDIDVRFRRDGTGGTTWYFGTDAGAQPGGQTDFQSVAVHEIGHTFQQGHTINSSDPMNYSLTTGLNTRTLTAQNIAGGQFVISNGTGKLVDCVPTPMVAFDCGLPPVADFSFTSPDGCGAPKTINFTDASTGIPTSWAWDFGDGNTSTSQNPQHIYTSTGTYTVSLTVTNANGEDEEIKTDYISVYSAPTAASCTPVSNDIYGGAYGTGIYNVSFNTLNYNSSSASADGGYLDLSCDQITNLQGGNTYQLSVYLGSQPGNKEDVRVYIDYNNNGSFEDAGELVMNRTNVEGLQTINVTIPTNTVTGQILRMRVIDEEYFGYGGGVLVNSCGGSTGELEDGQAEDYGVLICNAPTITAGNNSRCGSGDITISATPSAGTIKWYDQEVGGNLLHTGNSYSIVGLNTTTTYYAEAINGSCTSDGREAVTATINPIILPTSFSSVVNGFTSVDLSWNEVNADNMIIKYRKVGNTKWQEFNVVYANSYELFPVIGEFLPGTEYEWRIQLDCNGTLSSNSTIQYFTTPCAKPTGLTASNISLNNAELNWNSSSSDFMIIQYRKVGNTKWQSTGEIAFTKPYNLESALGTFSEATDYEWRIRLKCGTNYSEFSDISEFATPCKTAIALSADQITLNDVNVSWTHPGGNNMIIEYRKQGNSKWQTTGLIGYQNPYILTPLIGQFSNNTTYEYRIRVECNSMLGNYSLISTFVTPDNSGMIIQDNQYKINLLVKNIETYPNPNHGNFTISTSFEGTVNIVNELGQIIQRVEITKDKNYQSKVEGLARGVYFVTGTFEGEVLTQKVIVH
jgi:PKD repeat protein